MTDETIRGVATDLGSNRSEVKTVKAVAFINKAARLERDLSRLEDKRGCRRNGHERSDKFITSSSHLGVGSTFGDAHALDVGTNDNRHVLLMQKEG
jgi:hypothetical protein